MNETSKFTDTIAQAADKIAELLKDGGEITSWDIKLKLHLSSSALYLALGWLAARKISFCAGIFLRNLPLHQGNGGVLSGNTGTVGLAG